MVPASNAQKMTELDFNIVKLIMQDTIITLRPNNSLFDHWWLVNESSFHLIEHAMHLFASPECPLRLHRNSRVLLYCLRDKEKNYIAQLDSYPTKNKVLT